MNDVDTDEVTASFGATVIARSTRTVFLEGNHYFPVSDVDMRVQPVGPPVSE